MGLKRFVTSLSVVLVIGALAGTPAMADSITFLGSVTFDPTPGFLRSVGRTALSIHSQEQPAPLPEPGSLVLLGLGLLAAAYACRRRQRRAGNTRASGPTILGRNRGSHFLSLGRTVMKKQAAIWLIVGLAAGLGIATGNVVAAPCGTINSVSVASGVWGDAAIWSPAAVPNNSGCTTYDVAVNNSIAIKSVPNAPYDYGTINVDGVSVSGSGSLEVDPFTILYNRATEQRRPVH